jgi:dipeptidyl aminopeptidase/acylaminoacyl peptidase
MDGAIDGWLLYPAGYEEGKAYPTALFIHGGGPHGVYGLISCVQCQILASKGYGRVEHQSPREASPFGQDVRSRLRRGLGRQRLPRHSGGGRSVIERGVADPERLFVTGWSLWRLMTSWTITQTNSSRRPSRRG